jgi:hypothetical protein
VRAPLILIVVGHVLLVPPHHAPIRRSVEVSIFRARGDYFVKALRTRRDGSFETRLIADNYIFRVRPTRKPYCHSTAVRIDGSQRGQRVPVRISVPTNREHGCGPNGVNSGVNMPHTARRRSQLAGSAEKPRNSGSTALHYTRAPHF